MRILNLYAGLGGNRKLWEGHEIVAVEMDEKIANAYKRQFPGDILVIGDAHQYLLDHCDEFDMVWSSPPCQTHSRMMKATRHKKRRYTDMALYQEIIFLKHFYRGLWVVENVMPFYDPLIPPTISIGRHCFWRGSEITRHHRMPNHPNFIKADSPEEVESMKKWLGIAYEGNIYYGKNHSPAQVLRNCVHPETGLFILNELLKTNP